MVSLEALAMAGVGWAEYGKSVEDWELEDLDAQPPDHLLADGSDEEEEEDHVEELTQCVADAEVGKLCKAADHGLEDDVFEAFYGWWSSEWGCLGFAKMELKLKMEMIIRKIERLK